MAIENTAAPDAKRRIFFGDYEDDTDLDLMRACVLWCQQNDIGELLAIEFDEEAPTEYETDGGRYLYLIYLE